MEICQTAPSQDLTTAQVNPLDPFLALAKTIQEDCVVHLIIQIIEAQNIFVFGEFFDCPIIAAAKHHPEYNKYYSLLEVFAYETYADYKRNACNLPSLSDCMTNKLKLLTIVSLATDKKKLLIADIGKEIDISSNRMIEDTIIEALSTGLISGKIDQKNGLLEVDFATSRDVKLGDLSNIITKLEEWCKSCDGVLSTVDEVSEKANCNKREYHKHRIDLEEDIFRLKSNIKITPDDESMVTESSDREKRRGKKYKFWPKTYLNTKP